MEIPILLCLLGGAVSALGSVVAATCIIISSMQEKNEENLHRNMYFAAGAFAHMTATRPDEWQRIKAGLASIPKEQLIVHAQALLGNQADALWTIHQRPE